jgi:hypothetical protein
MAELNHEIIIMPHNTLLASLHTGELGKAMIAGASPAQTWYEDLAPALTSCINSLAGDNSQIKIVFVIHDGFPNDAPEAKRICKAVSEDISIIGIGLALDAGCAKEMTNIFGIDNLILCDDPGELPAKMVAIIRFIYGL